MVTDIIFAVGSVIMFISMLPSLLTVNKPHHWTSLVTLLVLAGYFFAFMINGMIIPALSTILLVCAWFVLFVQRLAQKRKPINQETTD